MSSSTGKRLRTAAKPNGLPLTWNRCGRQRRRTAATPCLRQLTPSPPNGRSKVETRNLPAEVKLERREDGGAVIRGRGAVYYRKDDPGTEYELWPGVVERIMPGAFDDVIGGDVRSFF